MYYNWNAIPINIIDELIKVNLSYTVCNCPGEKLTPVDGDAGDQE